jgi:hypothetical protein
VAENYDEETFYDNPEANLTGYSLTKLVAEKYARAAAGTHTALGLVLSLVFRHRHPRASVQARLDCG